MPKKFKNSVTYQVTKNVHSKLFPGITFVNEIKAHEKFEK